ncbi:MAG: STAS domain-containing protein [Ruminococcus sp.]|nr:STAS domain-containing protein [Ruminococcus sp.]
MDIVKERDGSKLTVYLKGRIDTTTAPQIVPSVEGELPDTAELIIDCADLSYLSSAGLRSILYIQQEMDNYGTLVFRNVCPTVYDVFDMCGFLEFLTIE